MEHHIQIKIDVFSYTIDGILSQMTLDDLAQCHLVVFFFQKMNPTKSWYETYNGELLAIIEVLILIDNNNF